MIVLIHATIFKNINLCVIYFASFFFFYLAKLTIVCNTMYKFTPDFVNNKIDDEIIARFNIVRWLIGLSRVRVLPMGVAGRS